MGISRATYYRKSTKVQERLISDLELKETIEAIHLELPGYGYRRIAAHLKNKENASILSELDE